MKKTTKDDVDLVAAALGLRSTVWAKAVTHLTQPSGNYEMNGKPLCKKCGKFHHPDHRCSVGEFE